MKGSNPKWFLIPKMEILVRNSTPYEFKPAWFCFESVWRFDKPKNITAVADVPINKRLFNMIDNNFINGSVAGLLPEAEYQFERDKFMKTADFAIILYADSIKEKEDVVIVTEETSFSNDGKPFKKIPGICDTIGVKTLNLPSFLSENSIIDLTVEVQKTSLF